MAATKKPATKQPARTAPAKKAVAKKLPAKKEPAKKVAPKKAAPAKQPADKAVATNSHPAPDTELPGIPAPRGKTKDGIAYTKDFDVKFLKIQQGLLIAERATLLGQANRLEDEANSLIEDGEMGDVQFDDESGEGDTMVVERERDLALSAQARQTIADIDAALVRMRDGTYGYSVVSGRPIPRERLEAIPWATVLVEEKVGGIGRR
jgi:RNA polymerase-binding transcription factor DksA